MPSSLYIIIFAALGSLGDKNFRDTDQHYIFFLINIYEMAHNFLTAVQCCIVCANILMKTIIVLVRNFQLVVVPNDDGQTMLRIESRVMGIDLV